MRGGAPSALLVAAQALVKRIPDGGDLPAALKALTKAVVEAEDAVEASPQTRAYACHELLDRGHGRLSQSVTDEGGVGPYPSL